MPDAQRADDGLLRLFHRRQRVRLDLTVADVEFFDDGERVRVVCTVPGFIHDFWVPRKRLSPDEEAA